MLGGGGAGCCLPLLLLVFLVSFGDANDREGRPLHNAGGFPLCFLVLVEVLGEDEKQRGGGGGGDGKPSGQQLFDSSLNDSSAVGRHGDEYTAVAAIMISVGFACFHAPPDDEMQGDKNNVCGQALLNLFRSLYHSLFFYRDTHERIAVKHFVCSRGVGHLLDDVTDKSLGSAWSRVFCVVGSPDQ
jgi:hypothetical protein